MNVFSYIDVHVYLCIGLFYIFLLARRKLDLSLDKNKYFIYMVGVTFVILVLEISSVAMIKTGSGYEKLVILHKWINILGFSFAPVVPYLWLAFVKGWCKQKASWIWRIIIGANGLIALSSYYTGFIFSVDVHNHYHRGPLFVYQFLLSYGMFANACYSLFRNRELVEKDDFTTMVIFCAIPMGASVVQVITPNILLMWPGAAAALIIVYIFLQQRLMQYDVLTQVWNRYAFENYMSNYICARKKKVTLALIDLDSFKNINDTFGHKEGDEALRVVADILRSSTGKSGRVVRMGGDEFIILLDSTEEMKTQKILENINDQFYRYNSKKDKPYHIEFSVGYLLYDSSLESLEEVLHKIDELMYVNKEKNRIERKESNIV